MKKLLLSLLVILAICMPGYSKVLVYDISASERGASIDTNSENAVLAVEAAKAYLVLDINDANAIANVAWIPFNAHEKVFVANSTVEDLGLRILKGVRSNVWLWDFEVQNSLAEVNSVGTETARLVGKTAAVKVGKKNLGRVPQSLKGVETIDEVADDVEFSGISSLTVALNGGFTKRANDATANNVIGTPPGNFIDVVAAIKASLAKKFDPVGECRLTIVTVGHGTVAAVPNKATYNYGDIVALTATADTNSTFAGFSGDKTTADSPASVTIIGNMTIRATFTDKPKAATPTITLDPNGGQYFTGQTVTVSMACATAGAVIHYTTDGNEPTAESATYTVSLSVTSSETVKAIAVKTGYINSDVASATLTFSEMPKAATPTITLDPNGGTYSLVDVNTVTVTLVCATDGAVIHYTTDGNEPTATSATYAGSFKVTSLEAATITVKAIAVKTDYIDSDIVSETLTFIVSEP